MKNKNPINFTLNSGTCRATVDLPIPMKAPQKPARARDNRWNKYNDFNQDDFDKYQEHDGHDLDEFKKKKQWSDYN